MAMSTTWLLRLASLCAGLLSAAAAQAQISLVPPADPAERLECLQVPPGEPGYERALVKRGVQGVVRVALRFTAPDRPPKVTMLSNETEVDLALSDAVRFYVEGYRLPCLRPGQAAVTAFQRFHFDADNAQPIHWQRSEATPDDDAKRRVAACLVAPRETLQLPYQGGTQATRVVMVKYEFVGADQPPRVSIHYSKADREINEYVLSYARGYRAPCMRPEDGPVSLVRGVKLVGDDGTERFARPFGLLTFLASTKTRNELQADFDFNAMGCPFDVQWTYWLPGEETIAGEVGAPDPRRAAFLRWLSHLEIKLPDDKVEVLLGEALTIQVPCGHLRLPRP